MKYVTLTTGPQAAIYDTFRRSNLRARRRNAFFKTVCVALGFVFSILLGLGAGQLAALVELPIENQIEVASER
jgi:hypothetical protein